MRILAALLLVFVVGVAVGWVVSPGPYRFLYKTQRPVMLTHESGGQIGVLPAGVVLLTEKNLHPNGEFGWFGYACVYFGDERQAATLVTATPNARPSILRNYFRGDPVPYAVFAADPAAANQSPALPDASQPSSQPLE